MGIKQKLTKLVDKATLKLVDAINPEIEEDSYLDLKIEQIEGREHVERPIVEREDKKPIYRKDGQVHSFAAAPWPGQKRLTEAQYNARYGGARPEPKHSVAGLVDVLVNDFDTNPPESIFNRDGTEVEAKIDDRVLDPVLVKVNR